MSTSTSENGSTNSPLQFGSAGLPQHVAIIMDGNGRWAERQNKPRVAGHRAGVEIVRDAVKTCGELGIKALTHNLDPGAVAGHARFVLPLSPPTITIHDNRHVLRQTCGAKL